MITGIYGGSFNPIHEGHVRLAKALADSGLVDEMWLLVSPQNPFKVDAQLLDDEKRLHLARLAVADVPGVAVCDREFSMPRPSYMYNTLSALSAEHPDREFVLVIGADNWERFTGWYRSSDILSAYRIIIYPRPGYVLRDVPKGITIADTPLLDISSTEIRHRIATQPDFDGEGLPPAVWEEIRREGLYCLKKHKSLNL
ncbi:MAG: nicotinate (nicotinamide) nucleotide adenylyltransferase [Bacteroidaceae bacterium]|nr:nicotinate (nicotinamide) nucleotide adenylyltransferase [Bacteroidaceae bacterium]